MDLFAGIFELLAKIVVGQKQWWGYLIHLLAGILWTIIAFRTRVYGLLIITVPAFAINICNMVKWWKER